MDKKWEKLKDILIKDHEYYSKGIMMSLHESIIGERVINNILKIMKDLEDEECCSAYEKRIRADAIEECIKTITDYCGGLPNNNLINALEQLRRD